ncbi:hypothetical protein BBF96_14340 [Anoxybacter fermentans]|uniref:Radical SAM core domain-containing protein n=1 Tax=Anoxybacter fermentans TaxID=1323375 RepID=A0A3Q9HS22_9FIRM|nr:PqqD family peptide modification chaperone [Anoxybacter fermentans]AZR74461.1 hypothetical protein BBF96_14340 [Anoxybacter fermentans]
MYPLFVEPYVLVKQYGDSIIYKWNQTSMEYNLVNRTGAEILELCDEKKTIEKISEEMAIRYSEDYNRAKVLTSNFIYESIKEGYIVMNDKLVVNLKQRGKIYGDFDRVTPMAITIELTRQCPLICRHCYNSAGYSMKDEMNFEEVLIVLKKLQEMGANKLFITGGEPTIRQDFINILDEISKRFFVATVATSGYMFTPEFVEKIKNYKNIAWQISIDGMEKTHNIIRGRSDSFERANFAIKSLKKYKLPVVISFTLNPLNRNEMESVIQYGKKMGVVQVLIGRTMKMGRAINENWSYNFNEFKEIEEEINRLKSIYETENFFIGKNEEGVLLDKVKEQQNCGAGYISINILPNGDVTPCTAFNYLLGNLVTDEIDDIFASKKVLMLKNLKSPTKNLCGSCELLDTCDGCHGMAYQIKKEDCIWKKKFEESVK